MAGYHRRSAFISCIALCAALAGCVSIPGAGLQVIDPMVRPAAAGATTGGYFTVMNRGSVADQLLSVDSPVAESVELHETIDDNGVMRMIPHPEGFEVPAGGKLELKPGGKHVMLIGVSQPLEEGQSISLTLHFEQSGTIAVTATIGTP